MKAYTNLWKVKGEGGHYAASMKEPMDISGVRIL